SYELASSNAEQADKNILVGSPASSRFHFPKKLAARIMFEEAVTALDAYPELSIQLFTPHQKTGKKLNRLIDR
ncbi:MAG: hypothetical protein JWQ23_1219, partial [Herminiimonas sp.]|nr:hypothetical protein [Herminiimonas sp.]